MATNDKGVNVGNLATFKEECDKMYIANDKVQNFDDTQKVQAQNNMMGKAYAPAQNSGLGKVYLDKNNGVLTQAMMPIATQEGEEDPGRNTVYVIQYDYTLGENITIPAGCTLQFDGGCISGGGTGKDTITGTNTQIIASDFAIFNNGIMIGGTWLCSYITSEWFSDITNRNRIQQLFKLTNDTHYSKVVITNKTYNVYCPDLWSVGVAIPSNTYVVLLGTINQETANTINNVIVNIQGKENITISGNGRLIGDKDTSSTTATESRRYGINIQDSKNIIIDGLTISKCGADGIIIGTQTVYNCTIKNCEIFECRRQGISLTNYENVNIQNCYIHDIYGENPYWCIDAEINLNLENTYKGINLSIKNCRLEGKRGINVYSPIGQTDREINNVLVANCIIDCPDDPNTTHSEYNENEPAEIAISWCGRSYNGIIENNVINGIILGGSDLFGFVDDTILYESNVFHTTRIEGRGARFSNNVVETAGECYISDGLWDSNKIVYSHFGNITKGSHNNDVVTLGTAGINRGIWKNCEISFDSHGYAIKGGEYESSKIHIACVTPVEYVIVADDTVGAVKMIGNQIDFTHTDEAGFAALIIQRTETPSIFTGNHLDWQFEDGYKNLTLQDTYLQGVNNHKRAAWKSLNFCSKQIFSFGNNVSNGYGVIPKSSTAARLTPTPSDIGIRYFDTTVNKELTWTGTAWVDATGTVIS